MQVNWYKKLFKERLRKLESMRKTVNGKELELISSTILILHDLLDTKDKFFSEENFEMEFLEQEYKNLVPSSFLWNSVREFSTFHFPDDIDVPMVPDLKISNKDVLDLVHDFFKNATNKEIYELFMKLFKERKKYLHFVNSAPEDFYGDSIYLPYSNELFIQMTRQYEFADISTLAHEYGHGIQFLVSFHDNMYQKNIVFIEIISMFFEMIITEYYSNGNELKKGAIINQFDSLDTLFEDARFLWQELDVLETFKIREFENKNVLKAKMQSFIDNPTLNIEELCDCLPSGNYLYIIATTIATELFMIYLNDPDKAFYLLFKIMHIDWRLSPEDYYEEIIKLGILPNEHMNDYTDHIKRKLTLL